MKRVCVFVSAARSVRAYYVVSSVLLMKLSQHVYFSQDFNLEVLYNLRCHLRALLRVFNTPCVVIDRQDFVDVCGDFLGGVAFQGWHSNVVEDGVLQALLGRRAEEWIVLEHVAHQLGHIRRAGTELMLQALFEAGRLLRFYLVLVIHNIDIRDKGKIVGFQSAIAVIDDDDLVVTADNVGLFGGLTCHGRNRIAGVSFKEETLLHFLCDVLLSLGFVVLNTGLVQVRVNLELRAGKGLSKNAAHTPNVERALVVLLRQNYFRGSVPSGHDSG